MLTLLIAAFVLVTLVAIVGSIGLGNVTVEFGRALVMCAMVLMLISAVVGVVRGKMRA